MKVDTFGDRRPSRQTITLLGLSFASLLLIAAIGAAAILSGCAKRTRAEESARGIRLTHDGAVKAFPRFSPDGQTIAYAARVDPAKGRVGLFLMPRTGGEARRISPDTLALYPVDWSRDGTGIYCRGVDGQTFYHIGLDGSIRRLGKADPVSKLLRISPDGQTELMVKFNQDNYDIGVRKGGGAVEFLTTTPDWEFDATFGPGPDEVTVVSHPSLQAPISTISIWSPQTRTLTPLPLPEALLFEPTWSSDGQRMAFAVSRGEKRDVWFYDAKAGRAEPLTQDVEDVGCPEWSPEGRWLVICRSTSTSHLYAGDPKGTDRVQLTTGPARDFSPVVSPNGEWIAFLRSTPSGEDDHKGPSLCVMPVAGGEVKEFDLRGLTILGKGRDEIAWSQDSREIAFTANDGSSKMDVYRIGRDGERLARVTVEPGDECEPQWSPDGRFISYTRVGGGRTEVAVVPANGGVARVLSEEGTPSEWGTWTPNSDRVAYFTFRNDGLYEVWIVDPREPESRTRIISDKEMAWPVRWSADGAEIILARREGIEWHFSAFNPSNRDEIRIAKEVPLPSGQGTYIEFGSEGAKYRDLFYPGGIVIAEGKAESDLYLIDTRAILEARLAARGE